MPRRETLIQLSDELVNALDEVSERRGMNRSALVREVLEGFVAKERDDEKDRRLVEGYKRISPDAPDEWGDIAAWGEAATADAYAEEPLE